jgi:hypothetical protein
LTSACTVEAQRVEGSFEKTLTVGQPADIEIMSGSGSIEVRQGSVGRVEIRARVRAGDWGWSRSGLSAQERVKRIEANPPVEQQGNTVRIGDIKDADLRDGVSISYDVTIPPGSALRSKSGSGSQRIEGVDGDVVASSGSGSLTLRRSGGRVRASTGSGGITAQDVGGALEASTGSGSIDGMGVKGPITVRTSSGSIEVTQAAGGDGFAAFRGASARRPPAAAWRSRDRWSATGGSPRPPDTSPSACPRARGSSSMPIRARGASTSISRLRSPAPSGSTRSAVRRAAADRCFTSARRQAGFRFSECPGKATRFSLFRFQARAYTHACFPDASVPSTRA